MKIYPASGTSHKFEGSQVGIQEWEISHIKAIRPWRRFHRPGHYFTRHTPSSQLLFRVPYAQKTSGKKNTYLITYLIPLSTSSHVQTTIESYYFFLHSKNTLLRDYMPSSMLGCENIKINKHSSCPQAYSLQCRERQVTK